MSEKINNVLNIEIENLKKKLEDENVRIVELENNLKDKEQEI